MENSTSTGPGLFQDILEKYRNVLDKRDPRVDGWILTSSPFPTFLICFAYVYLVKVWGPNYMKKRDPFDLRYIIIFYNGIQVCLSLWIFYQFGRGGWFGSYNWFCQPVDYNENMQAITMLHACWWFYVSKFTEFFDTIFFVMRKKNEHVSALHVIHHSCMPINVWLILKFAPGGHGTLAGFLNTLIHTVMYSYYLMAAMGPKYQKHLWWKKYLTIFQIVQFCIIFVHVLQLLFIECDYPKFFVGTYACFSALFFFLFTQYYQKNKIEKKKKL